MKTYKIQSRREEGSPWSNGTTVQDDNLEFAQDVVVRYNEEAGFRQWRIIPAEEETNAE